MAQPTKTGMFGEYHITSCPYRRPRHFLSMKLCMYFYYVATVLLQLCSTQDIPCSGAQGGSGTIYRAHLNETDCHFMWSNSLDYTLANDLEDKVDEAVISRNITTLVLNTCYRHVTLTVECTKEGKNMMKYLMKYTANCTIPCSEPPHNLPLTKGNCHHKYLVPLFCIALFVVVIFAVTWRILKEEARRKNTRTPRVVV